MVNPKELEEMALSWTVTKTYSLTAGHTNKVRLLAELKNVSQGEIVRQAIDLLWEKSQDKEGQS